MRVTQNGIYLHLACLCLASATPLFWAWASRESNKQRLLRLYPTSLVDCLDVCFNNDDCQGVVYKRLATLCDLHDVLEPLDTESSRESIIVHRRDILERGLGLPYDEKPVHSYTKACSMSEIAGSGYRRFGNMNRAGDRIVIDYGLYSPECSAAIHSCDDDGKWIERGCKEKPRDCSDFRETLPSGIYTIYPNGLRAFEVFCDIDDPDGPWTVIQRRVDDTVNFYRSYESYVEGFGDHTGNVWLGLDAISTITLTNSRQYKLKVVIHDPNMGERFAEYSMFQVMDASSGYMLQVGEYSGNAGDSLIFHNGRQFSTYDMDRDSIPGNCAEVYTGAWWYNACHKSNLNGKYGDDRYGKGLNWYTTTGYYRSAIFATMKLKPFI